MTVMRPELDEPHVHHEESDVNISAIFRFGAALAAGMAAVGVVVWLLFQFFERREAGMSRASPLAASRGAALPPEPRLQERPREELRDLRAEEDALLTSYGWVDREAGTVRIPIAEAMRLTIERGLPTRASEPASAPRGGGQP
jgi:hypothetical protein